MPFKKQYSTAPFDENDQTAVREIVKRRHNGIIMISVGMFLIYWVSPYISRTGTPLIFEMPYWNALLYHLPVLPAPTILAWFFSRKVFGDARTGSKIILQTRITAQKGSRKNMKIKVSAPNIFGWLSFENDETPDIHVNDDVRIEMLPESKIILRYEKQKVS